MAEERGSQRRERRRDEFVGAATELVSERGLDGLTMQAVADRVDCAVGTIYTYFPSKSALLAALMSDAVQHLLDAYRRSAAGWDTLLDDAPDDAAAVARVLAFTDLFVESRELYPKQFEFLQMLITTPESLIDPDDVASVLPSSLAFLAEIHGLLDGALRAGALDEPADGDDGLRRTLRWTGAIHGVLLVSNVAHVSGLPMADAYDPRTLTEQVTVDLLLAWGADDLLVEQSRALRERIARAGAAAETDD